MPEDNQAVELFDGRARQIARAGEYRAREALKEIEAVTRRNFEAQITYHRLLLDAAKEHGEVFEAMHHQIMIDTFEGLLRNFTMSGSYGRI